MNSNVASAVRTNVVETRSYGSMLAGHWAGVSSLLAIPGLIRLSAGSGLALSGLRLQNIAVAWLVLDLTGSRASLGLVNGLPALAVVFFSLLGGVLADSGRARQALVGTRLVLSAGALVLGLMVTTGQVQVALLVPMVVIAIGATAVDMPIGRTLLYQTLGSGRLLSGTAMNSMGLNISNMVGPMVFGLLIARFGVDVALYALAGWYLLAAVLVPAKPMIETQKRDMSPLAELKAGVAYLRATPSLAWLVSLAFLVPLAGVFFALVPVFARDVLSAGPAGLGLMMAAYGIGSISGSSYLILQGGGRRPGLIVCISGFVFTAGMVAFALSHSLALSSVVACVMGASAMLWQNTLSTMVQRAATPEMKGRITSVCTMGFQLVNVGWLLGGLLANSLGPSAAVIIAAVAFAGFSVLVFSRSPIIRQVT